MALHLIIDGYNLIRQSPELQRLDANALENGRQALLTLLAAYLRTRSPGKITVVFDGWQRGDLKETRDRQQGVLVVFSRRGERADEVIKRLLAQEGDRAVVVSSDREIQSWADRVGAVWMDAGQFEFLYLRRGGPTPGGDPNAPPSRTRSKKGPAHRLSKRQRQRLKRLRKL
jgi:predicted RNA-binding protein with PIN domain